MAGLIWSLVWDEANQTFEGSGMKLYEVAMLISDVSGAFDSKAVTRNVGMEDGRSVVGLGCLMA